MNWKQIAQECQTGSDTEIAEMLEKAYRLGVTNATGILRQHLITEEEEFREGAQWRRDFPQETADSIESVLLREPNDPPATP